MKASLESERVETSKTYGCLSDGSLSEFVEVDEELLDTDAILGDACHDALFDIILVAQHG